MPSSSLSTLSSTLSSSVLEVEQKFSFTNRSNIEDRLRQENFVPINEITMVDWYFDRLEDVDNYDDGDVDGDGDDSCYSLDLPLVRQDQWLRFRKILSHNNKSKVENQSGKWQLKRGTKNAANSSNSSSVYEEIEGIEAVRITHSILMQSQSQKTKSHDDKTTKSSSADTLFFGYVIPVLPIPDIYNDLEPFARIETRRSTWQQIEMSTKNNTTTTTSSNYGDNCSLFPNLIVDLDCVPDGYNLGEVEVVVDGNDINAVVNEEEAIALAQKKIEEFLKILLQNENEENEKGDEGNNSLSSLPIQRRPPMGKLEHFLFCNRPRIYRLCIESGVIPQRQPQMSIDTARNDEMNLRAK
mmetsp:Transcript_17927/g.19424  ORF Transcript_17927/g.19424 Transcript_17927/m.19424 type:complete len:355 (-) Transcript_17927:348-1412(-)